MFARGVAEELVRETLRHTGVCGARLAEMGFGTPMNGGKIGHSSSVSVTLRRSGTTRGPPHRFRGRSGGAPSSGARRAHPVAHRTDPYKRATEMAAIPHTIPTARICSGSFSTKASTAPGRAITRSISATPASRPKASAGRTRSRRATRMRRNARSRSMGRPMISSPMKCPGSPPASRQRARPAQDRA